MRVMIDYNGWRKVEDVSVDAVRSGKIQLSIIPPLTFDCKPTAVPSRDPSFNLIVYATGCQTDDGLMIFSNRV
ncbi:hypothetical protein Glov_2252 [Trichlorobacter lovleyi SZ]|jgi:hypothetical protein|uniref:Uncharacterized protein n=1 Tax=Trichlorobacter lovleyi (strain ATCC BAA-1151 / DSM 17278 / SZ) TaxID=398767 RepID=B3E4N2_TRIL1|nr:hypothetical protein Glov_2252 [Trichlorobacter lovleyi SZ]